MCVVKVPKVVEVKTFILFILVLSVSLSFGCSQGPTWPADAKLEAGELEGASASLTWPAATGEVAQYKIKHGEEVLGEVKDSTTFKATELKGKTEYVFQVVAENKKGQASKPLEARVLTGDLDAPTWKETDVLQTTVESRGALGAMVRFEWPAATDDTAVTKYRLMRGDEMIIELEETSYEYQSTQVDGDYTVLASDEAGNWSETGPSAKVWANRGLQNILRNEGLIKPKLMLD